MANLDQSWVNVDVDALMERYLGRAVVALNDADAAGIAEVAYGAAKGRDGVIVFTTQGTGIGSAIIVNGTLLTNTELGHLEIRRPPTNSPSLRLLPVPARCTSCPGRSTASACTATSSTFRCSSPPDLFIIGGGISKNPEKFMPYFEDQIRTPMVMAALREQRGYCGCGTVGWRHAAGTQAPRRSVKCSYSSRGCS